MSYTDYSNQWVIDQFLTFLQANQLGANCEHLYDSFAVEHNINTATIDGTHKANSITGSSINTTPASTGSQAIAGSTTWTPTVGVYQIVGLSANTSLSLFISGVWRFSGGADAGIMFFDGTNMRLDNTWSVSNTVYYQKF